MNLQTPIAIVLFAAAALCCAGNEWRMPRDQFERFRNRPDPSDGSGSCVQASLSMCGAHHGVPAFELLLQPSQFGPAELGGSTPSRVKNYAQARGVPIYSIEGSETLPWIEWGLRRGCYVGITYGRAHMITAVATAEDGSWFEIVDNNWPGEVRRVDRATFIHEHRIHGGGWCVLLKTPGPAPWARANPMVVSCALPRERTGNVATLVPQPAGHRAVDEPARGRTCKPYF